MLSRRLRLQLGQMSRAAAIPLGILTFGVVAQHLSLFLRAIRQNIYLTSGEVLLSALRGFDEFDAVIGGVFLLDAAWFLPQFALAFAACVGAMPRCCEYESQCVVRMGSRRQWIALRIMWCFCVALYFVALESGLAVACSSALGGRLDVSFFQVGDEGLVMAGITQHFVGSTDAACALSLAYFEVFTLLVFACMFSVAVGRLPSFVVSVAVLIASAFLRTHWLPFDFAMLARNSVYADGGFGAGTGFLICTLLLVLSVLIGVLRSERVDFV